MFFGLQKDTISMQSLAGRDNNAMETLKKSMIVKSGILTGRSTELFLSIRIRGKLSKIF